MKRYSKYHVLKSQAKSHLQKVDEAREEINRRLAIPPSPQRKINDFVTKKDGNYWTRYNKARTSEKRLFYMLLDDLLEIIPQPKIGNGRPPVPLRDLLFCGAIKLYNGFSARRISSDMDHAHRMGFIDKVPHFNTLLNFMKDPATYEILKYLITLSAMPIQNIETDFAMDASGFGSYQYERWMRVRFQKAINGKSAKRGWRNYVKLHISVGTQTQIITAAEVSYGNEADTKHLPYLVKQTSANFTAEKYLADKAYSSRKNFEIIAQLNALPFIPFKKNTTGRSRGCPLWHAMFDFFQNDQEGFKHYYGQRSQSESAFSRIKRNWGEFLKSKTFQAQQNEVLLKCLCHNIACLIAQIFERNLKINFEDDAKNIVSQ
jgi:transposase